jgi:hypothetical protein
LPTIQDWRQNDASSFTAHIPVDKLAEKIAEAAGPKWRALLIRFFSFVEKKSGYCAPVQGIRCFGLTSNHP